MLKQGDAKAWRSLVRALAGPLFRYARPLSLDDDSAEEIVQQTFIRLSRARLKPQGSLRTLAFHIATNLTRDERRNQSTRQRHEQEAAMAEAIHDDPSRQAMAKEAWQRALALPVELREVVLLRYGQGFTAAETAAVLGIPEGTVKTRQRKALESLRGSAMAAPALLALEGDLQAAASTAPVPASLTTTVETAIMASIGAKTGTNAGILILAALLLLGGIGTGIYFITVKPTSQANQQWPTLPSETASSKEADQQSQTNHPAPPVMAGPGTTDQQQPSDSASGAISNLANAQDSEHAAGSAPTTGEDAETAVDGDEQGEESEAKPGFRASVAGRVVDYSGEGVAGADVHVTYFVAMAEEIRAGETKELVRERVVRANSRGVYSFEIIDPRIEEELTAIVAQQATPAGKPRAISVYAGDLRLTLRNGERRTGVRLEIIDSPMAGPKLKTQKTRSLAPTRIARHSPGALSTSTGTRCPARTCDGSTCSGSRPIPKATTGRSGVNPLKRMKPVRSN